MQAPQQPKSLTAWQHMSGGIGNLILNPINPKNCKIQEHLYGNVIAYTDAKQYRVHFDNGKCIDVTSNSLHIENDIALPPQVKPEYSNQWLKQFSKAMNMLRLKKQRMRIQAMQKFLMMIALIN